MMIFDESEKNGDMFYNISVSLGILLVSRDEPSIYI